MSILAKTTVSRMKQQSLYNLFYLHIEVWMEIARCKKANLYSFQKRYIYVYYDTYVVSMKEYLVFAKALTLKLLKQNS